MRSKYNVIQSDFDICTLLYYVIAQVIVDGGVQQIGKGIKRLENMWPD